MARSRTRQSARLQTAPEASCQSVRLCFELRHLGSSERTAYLLAGRIRKDLGQWGLLRALRAEPQEA